MLYNPQVILPKQLIKPKQLDFKSLLEWIYFSSNVGKRICIATWSHMVL